MTWHTPVIFVSPLIFASLHPQTETVGEGFYRIYRTPEYRDRIHRRAVLQVQHQHTLELQHEHTQEHLFCTVPMYHSPALHL